MLFRLAAEGREKRAGLEGKSCVADGAVGQLPLRQVGQGIAEGKENQQHRRAGKSSAAARRD